MCCVQTDMLLLVTVGRLFTLSLQWIIHEKLFIKEITSSIFYCINKQLNKQ